MFLSDHFLTQPSQHGSSLLNRKSNLKPQTHYVSKLTTVRTQSSNIIMSSFDSEYTPSQSSLIVFLPEAGNRKQYLNPYDFRWIMNNRNVVRHHFVRWSTSTIKLCADIHKLLAGRPDPSESRGMAPNAAYGQRVLVYIDRPLVILSQSLRLPAHPVLRSLRQPHRLTILIILS